MPDLTITLTAGQLLRLQDAVGAIISPEGLPASNAEVKDFVVRFLRGLVQEREHRAAAAAILDSPFDPT